MEDHFFPFSLEIIELEFLLGPTWYLHVGIHCNLKMSMVLGTVLTVQVGLVGPTICLRALYLVPGRALPSGMGSNEWVDLGPIDLSSPGLAT